MDAKHDQHPISSPDPLAQLNNGNFATAISLYEVKAAHAPLSAEDSARLAHALQNTGAFGRSSQWFQKAIDADPGHKLAAKWAKNVELDATAERAGVAVLRPNKITKQYLDTDPVDLWARHPDNWVLCTDFVPAGSYTPPKSIKDRIANAGWAIALEPRRKSFIRNRGQML